MSAVIGPRTYDIVGKKLYVLTFFAVGKPEPGGSKRGFKHPHTDRVMVVDDNPRAKPWQGVVAGEAAKHMNGWPLIDAPLELDLKFVVARPKGHYGTGRNAHTVKASAPAFPVVKPDVLKLARAVEDALTGVVWRDDAQIVTERLTKRYGSPTGVRVTVREAAS